VALPLDSGNGGDAPTADMRRWGEEGLVARSNGREKGEGGKKGDDGARWPL
jgi:hypothetical protein